MLRHLVITSLLLFNWPAFAQKPQVWKPQVWGDPDGFTGYDCETTMMLLDFVAVADREGAKDQSIIIVARHGRGERSHTLIKRPETSL